LPARKAKGGLVRVRGAMSDRMASGKSEKIACNLIPILW
jgi:hypothetical protein